MSKIEFYPLICCERVCKVGQKYSKLNLKPQFLPWKIFHHFFVLKDGRCGKTFSITQFNINRMGDAMCMLSF
jgi:hypothetical protein